MRWLLAWALFWMGDFTSRIMRYWDRLGIVSLYPVYNRLMIWSGEIQGDGPGPWSAPA